LKAFDRFARKYLTSTLIFSEAMASELSPLSGRSCVAIAAEFFYK
jgi:hypothetical protein